MPKTYPPVSEALDEFAGVCEEDQKGGRRSSMNVMKTVMALVMLSCVAPAGAQPSAAPWECRRTQVIVPALPVVSSHSDRRQRLASMTFDAADQKLYGFDATYLSYSRQVNFDAEWVEINYLAVVNAADMDQIRWLVERSNPDLRCRLINGSFVCMAAVTNTETSDGLRDRTISIYRPNVEDGLSVITDGVAVACSWNEPLQPSDRD